MNDDIVFDPRNGEPAFTRINESIYTRQESLGIIRNQAVSVIGCGGIGAWVGYYLGLAGVRDLRLFDGDDITDHNLNRLPFTPADIGKSKSVALAALIGAARPEAELSAYGNFDPTWHRSHLSESSAVVVSTDSLKSRKMVYEAARVAGTSRYYELGADGFGATVTGEPAEWSTEAENEPGYQSVPVFVGPCTLAASIAAYYILQGKPIKDTFRIDWDDDAGLRVNHYVGV